MYQVILTGVREGVARSDAIKNLAALFKTTPEQVERLLASSGHVLKKGITEEVSVKYRSAIEAAGGTCRVEQELVPVQTLDADLPRSPAGQEIPKNNFKAAQSSAPRALMKIGLVSMAILLFCIMVIFIKNRVKESKAQNTTLQTTEISAGTISRNDFKLIDNSNVEETYLNTEFFRNAEFSKNIRGVMTEINYDEPQQTANGIAYQSELQILLVSCDENKVVQVKGLMAAGLNMSGQIVGHGHGEDVISPTPGSEAALIKKLSCLSQEAVESVFSKAAQSSKFQDLISHYPATITIDITQFQLGADAFDFAKTPRALALASGQKLAQYAFDFAKSTNPTCQSVSATLTSTANKAGDLILTGDNLVKQGQSGTEIYDTARSVANAGLGIAASVGNCP